MVGLRVIDYDTFQIPASRRLYIFACGMSTFDPISLARPSVVALKPYSSARDEFTGTADVYLDANESPFNTGLNRYPDPYQKTLKAAIRRIKGVPETMMLLGNGSDEVIDLLFRVFCEPGKDQCLIMPPTYGMYQVSADINQVEVIKVLLNEDFSVNLSEVQSAITPQTKLVFVCSPNNPSGNLIDGDTLLQLAKLPCIVVVDEAYIDFADASSAITLISDHPNVVVMQTLSKAWGLAGIRLGLCFAHESIISLMNKVKPPYNINDLSQQVAQRAIENEAQMMSWVAAIKTQREVLKGILEALPVVEKVYPTDANFFLVKFNEDPKKIYEFLAGVGIVVRDRSTQPRCAGCLRITIGTMEENLKLVDMLQLYSASGIGE
jgi:histidinol-phosphate aminotransferase